MTKLLELSGEALEKELEKIVKDNPPDRIPWTPKEVDVLVKLRKKGVAIRVMAKVMGRTNASVKGKLQTI